MPTGIHAPFLSRVANDLARVHADADAGLKSADIRARISALDQRVRGVFRILSGKRVREIHRLPGTEWLLDNEYVIREALQQVRSDLPRRFYRQLPLAEHPNQGAMTRVESLVRATVDATELPLDMAWLEHFTAVYQNDHVLMIGELWALPALLRIVILEKLCECAERMLAAPKDASGENLEHCDMLAGCILTLSAINHFQWPECVERLSHVNQILARDPVQAYASMDFETRNNYRNSIEKIAKDCKCPEWQVAEGTVYLASAGQDENPRERHVGYFLIDRGRHELLDHLGYEPTLADKLAVLFRQQIPAIYVAAIIGSSAVLLALLCNRLLSFTTPGKALLFTVLSLPPALMLCGGTVNWLITRFKSPHLLPKMDFRDGIGSGWKTVVAVPALLSSAEELRELLASLETNYLGNTDPLLHYVLLTDFPDAPHLEMPGEPELMKLACNSIEDLNRRYGRAGEQPFNLLHRHRLWNESEGSWMGWERKRGKLAEFNQFLLHGKEGTFTHFCGDRANLKDIRLVICLDADTHLTTDSARSLVATLAHPLNRPVFDPQTGRVQTGYTIIQPRLEINPVRAGSTLFSRIFTGDVTFDLYTHAVSNVYQDTLSEGIFVGKGIYDLEGFTRSLEGELPENAILSHDLLEGLHGRTALASDIVLFEDFPSTLLSYIRRQHRWIRGDWQICPWMGWRGVRVGTHRARFHPRLMDRWKIFDNISRSLLFPCLLASLVAGWVLLPELAWQWGLAVAAVPGLPILFETLAALRPANWRWGTIESTLAGHARTLATETSRWILILIFLPYQSLNALDAICRTLFRLLVKRRHLLEWTSAAQTARQLGQNLGPSAVFVRMYPTTIFAAATAILVFLTAPESMSVSLPFILAWLLSPLVAWWISRPDVTVATALTEDETAVLRLLARRTWHFFETFVSPENHWLPPDNIQQTPKFSVAQRTSPTNIGFALLSILSAHDFGYLDLNNLRTRLFNTLQTLRRIPKYRGHFLNWIQTNDLRPLEPRYVSTVDSGNLAGCLIALIQGLEELKNGPVPSPRLRLGIADTVDVMRSVLARAKASADSGELARVQAVLDDLHAFAQHEGGSWWQRLADVETGDCERIEVEFLAALEQPDAHWSAEDIAEFRGWIRCLRREIRAAQREYRSFAPWNTLLAEIPDFYGRRGEPGDAWSELCALLHEPMTLPDIAHPERKTLPLLDRIDTLLKREQADSDRQIAAEWNKQLRASLHQAAGTAHQVRSDLDRLITEMHQIVDAMDFRFLYDEKRQLFHIGYNVSTGELDTSYYDLLASEARLASFIAIAQRQVPARHWMHLGRPLARIRGTQALLSWSATMFEYLMPNLLMECPERTLMNQSVRTVVDQARRYGKSHGTPWGISESGYYRLDQDNHYQYRAFGLPELGLSPSHDQRLVVSPYASILALPVAHSAVIENLDELRKLHAEDQFGMREALDYGPISQFRRNLRGKLVGSHMAHHQGMIMLALDNTLFDDSMIKRFHSDPRISSIKPLLYEATPHGTPTIAAHRTHIATDDELPLPRIVQTWTAKSSETAINVLSNGRLNTCITSQGGGGQYWNDVALTCWDPRMDGPIGGLNLYFKDMRSSETWSLGTQYPNAGELDVEFGPHQATFVSRKQNLLTRMTIVVAPDADVEMRRLVMTNESNTSRSLFVFLAAEPLMVRYKEFRRHPAFSRLFIESEFIAESETLVFRRRPRSADQDRLYMGYAVVTQPDAEADLYFGNDRRLFLGKRGDPHHPASLNSDAPAHAAPGDTPDPWMELGITIEIPAHDTVQLTFLTAVADTQRKVLDTVAHFQSVERISWSMSQARTHSEYDLQNTGLQPDDARTAMKILAKVFWPEIASDVKHAATKNCKASQSSLWRHGISGDHPIVMMSLEKLNQIGTAAQLLRCHTYWNLHGMAVDLVFLDENSAGYNQPTRDRLHSLIEPAREYDIPFRGKAVIVPASALDQQERNNLVATAAVYLEPGTTIETFLLRRLQRPAIPPFVPVPSAPLERLTTEPLKPLANLQFENGYGGFSQCGREYVMYQPQGTAPPAPWVNILANPGFGCLTTSAGLDFTWRDNSSEYRLTPWHNDPVTEQSSEALYFRDEETAETWSPTPLPRGDGLPYQVAHGAGYTRFEHNSNGLNQRLEVFIDPEEPVKMIRVQLKNCWPRSRRVTLTYVVEWLLGNSHADNADLLVPETDPASHAILVRNGFNRNQSERMAFLAASMPPHGITTDLYEFLGPDRSWRDPAGLRVIGLSGNVTVGPEVCGVYQVHIDLAVEQTAELHFLLGTGEHRDDALDRIRRFQDAAFVMQRRAVLEKRWDELLGKIRVKTPDPALDLLTNRWLLYQTISSRLWGRTGFYQPGGAFGFRDQLQDVLALLWAAPAMAREQILRAAAVQFEEGDVLHWWHTDPLRGVRTRCSDDLLWLPYVVSEYVRTTGDDQLLDRQVAWLDGAKLEAGEGERYAEFVPSGHTASIYEHCCRAIDARLAVGAHELPFIGTGDWNDGLNRVGAEGKGESVWMAWFLCFVIDHFAPLCERRGDAERARFYAERTGDLAQASEKNAWDGDWYLRGFYDDGNILGGAASNECRIDLNAQTWAVISGAARSDRMARAMQAVQQELVDPHHRLIKLLAPPFEKSVKDPGYIK